jgi:hypothetical protein
MYSGWTAPALKSTGPTKMKPQLRILLYKLTVIAVLVSAATIPAEPLPQSEASNTSAIARPHNNYLVPILINTIVVLFCGAGLFWYFRRESARLNQILHTLNEQVQDGFKGQTAVPGKGGQGLQSKTVSDSSRQKEGLSLAEAKLSQIEEILKALKRSSESSKQDFESAKQNLIQIKQPILEGFPNIRSELSNFRVSLPVIVETQVKGSLRDFAQAIKQLERISEFAHTCDSLKQQLQVASESYRSDMQESRCALSEAAKSLSNLSGSLAESTRNIQDLVTKSEEARRFGENAVHQADMKVQEALSKEAEAAAIKTKAEQLESENNIRRNSLDLRESQIHSEEQRVNLSIERELSVKAENETLKATAEAANRGASENLRQVEAIKKEADASLRNANELFSSFWPSAFIQGGGLAAHRELITSQLAASKVEAGMLLAALYRYHLSQKASDTREMPAILSEVGRRAYSFWRSQDLTPQQCCDHSDAWTEAFNSELKGQFKLKVARPGVPKEISWMSYTQGGPVSEVDGWAVFSANDIVVRKAEVN